MQFHLLQPELNISSGQCHFFCYGGKGGVVIVMTEKQKIFADEYIIDLNGIRAYKTAYPNIKNDNVAAARASKLLKMPEIKVYIQKRLDELADKRVAKQQEVLEYLTSVMRGQSESEVIVVEGCGDGMSQAVKVKKAPDERERLKAAELLGKRYGTWKEKLEVKDEAEEKKKQSISNIEALMKQMVPVKEDDISE